MAELLNSSITGGRFAKVPHVLTLQLCNDSFYFDSLSSSWIHTSSTICKRQALSNEATNPMLAIGGLGQLARELLRGFHAHSDETSRGVPYSVLCFVSKGEEVFLNLSRRMGCSRGTRKQAEEHQYCSSIKINDDALGDVHQMRECAKETPRKGVSYVDVVSSSKEGLRIMLLSYGGDSTMVVIGFLKEDCKVLEVRDDRQGKPCVVGLMPSIVPLQVDQVVGMELPFFFKDEGASMVMANSLVLWREQDEGNFISFGKWLGLPMDGFEKEVASLLRKLEATKDHRMVASSIERRSFSTSQFEGSFGSWSA
ncbi:hypothetical protein CK203_011550 [Vitis vinifera]|uniref:Uncharacterized protein n=1 Tax=Vitis vinifera TaxID=29760 RepID=A0A438JUV7_VITVI|nr:hypothetical protein CK203_011550 [Vitis vinifera]